MNRINAFIFNNSYLFISIGMFFLIVILINPLSNAPTDDDFAYAWMVKNLHETGRYVLHEWSFVNILFQTCYGLIFVFKILYDILDIANNGILKLCRS